MRGLGCCDSQAQLPLRTWDLPEPGIEPLSPALAGGFFTPGPPSSPGLHLMWGTFPRSAPVSPGRNLQAGVSAPGLPGGGFLTVLKSLPEGQAMPVFPRVPSTDGRQAPSAGRVFIQGVDEKCT